MHPRIISIVVLAAIPAIVTSAHAQGASGRGLFGGTNSEGGGGRFDVTFGLSGAYDTEVPAELRTGLPQDDLDRGGFSTMLTTSAIYNRAARRVHVSGSGDTSFRYAQQVSDIVAVGHSGAVGVRVNLSRAATAEVNQTLAYSPSYLFELFPGIAPPALGETTRPAPEFRVDSTNSYSYGTNLTVAVGSRRGRRLSGGVDYGHTQHEGASVRTGDISTRGARVAYSQGVGRSATLSAEYGYFTGQFPDSFAKEHRASFGAEYSRALSASRRATVRITVSPSLIDIADAPVGALMSGRVRRLQAEGGAAYQFHLGWQAGVSYRRSTEYVPAFTEPVLAHSVSGQVNGLITRRLDVTGSVGLAKAGSAFAPGGNELDTYELDTYMGTARLRFAVSRRLALYSEYFYYVYDLRGQPSLAPALPPRFEQSGARVGLMLWSRLF